MDFNRTTGHKISCESKDVDGCIRTKGERYLKIWDFMLFDLDLKKTELFIYALIFSINYNYKDYFRGSRKYIQTWTGASLRAISYALSSLQKKDYIFAYVEKTKRGNRNAYCINVTKLPECETFYAENRATKFFEEERAKGLKFELKDVYAPEGGLLKMRRCFMDDFH